MSATSLLQRLMLLAYPRSFRDQYGEEMLRTLRDLRRHGGMSRPRLALQVARDVVVTAPRLRIEALLTRTKVIAILSLAALAATLFIAGTSRFLLLILVPLALLAIVIHHHDRPITSGVQPAHWWRWGASGAALLGTLIVAEGAGPDFDWFPWLGLWFLALMGLALLAIGLVLGVVHAIARVRHTIG
jgi:hypothetical protein